MTAMTQAEVIEHAHCRNCLGRLELVHDLGAHYVSDFPKEPWTDEPRVPLRLARCGACGLVQLSHTVPRDRLYRQYWYRSGVQPAMVEALHDLTTWARRFVVLRSGDYVVDIGANDGTLLRLVGQGDARLNRVAFDPAINLHSSLREHCEILIPDYFPAQQYDAPPAMLIFSIAMFYDLPDPRAFVREIKRCLHVNGIWILQFGDLRGVLLQNGFDAICHEHLEYYSMPVVQDLLEQEGLRVVDAERNDVNGGSLRLAVAHAHSSAHGPSEERRQRVAAIRAEDQGLDLPENWAGWSQRLVLAREIVRDLVEESWRRGDPVDLLGASTKCNTLLQYFQLGPGYAERGEGPDIRRAIERSPQKWGRFTVGSWIPIVSEEEGWRDQAKLLLVGPWHFRDALVQRQRQLCQEGELLFPLPFPERVHP